MFLKQRLTDFQNLVMFTENSLIDLHIALAHQFDMDNLPKYSDINRYLYWTHGHQAEEASSNDTANNSTVSANTDSVY